MEKELAHSPLVRKFSALMSLSNEEIDCLEGLHERHRSYRARAEIIHEGDDYSETMIIKDGWAIRYKMLSDGRRQIVNFLLPGDLIGPFASVFQSANQSVAAVTDLAVCPFPSETILELFAGCPRLGAAIAWAVGREDAIVAEHVVRVGRRSAYERCAHLLIELLKRLQLVGHTEGRGFELPITQEMLADTLGLSIVHMNRTLRRLRINGLVRLADGFLVIDDMERLKAIADFSPGYLDQTELPQKTKSKLSRIS